MNRTAKNKGTKITNSLPETATEINTSQTSFLTNSISEELLAEALKVEATVETPKNKEITSEQLINFAKKVAETFKVPTNIAYIGICSTLQAGGSNKNKRSNVKITILNTAFESKKINELIQQQLKITPRQLARIIADDIYKIAEKHKITGNAYVSLKRFYPHLLENLDNEKFWAADFQVDNPYCPEYIREALRKRYADKFVNTRKQK